MSIEIHPDNIWLDFTARSHTDAIHIICNRLYQKNKTIDPEGLYADIIRRESMVSTYAGHDTAIPHVISSHVDQPILCFIRVNKSDFVWHGASEKVTFIIFSAIPANKKTSDDKEQHSRLFAAVAQLLHKPEITNRWKITNDQKLICDDLNRAFR